MAVTTNKGKGAAAPSAALSKKERGRQERARQRRNRRLWQIGLVVLVGGGLAALLLFAIFRPQPGQEVMSQGNAHITEAQMGQFAYNTSPPTSGPHLGSLADWGVHEEPIPNELQVHNLEDGGVIVHYNCPNGCSDLVGELEGIVEGYHEGVILEPYPDMDTRIALTAWQRIDQFDEFDGERIERFIRAYRGVDHHQ
jgi:hypothetical protein